MPSQNFSLRGIRLIFVLLAIFIAVSSSRAQDCSVKTDDQLVTEILDAIKGDSLLAPQMSHIVVGSVNKFVKLQGWTDSKRAYDRLYSIVTNTSCVKAINVNRFEETPPPADSPLRMQGGGCAAGMKACGDVCIPEGEACSDRTKSGGD